MKTSYDLIQRFGAVVPEESVNIGFGEETFMPKEFIAIFVQEYLRWNKLDSVFLSGSLVLPDIVKDNIHLPGITGLDGFHDRLHLFARDTTHGAEFDEGNKSILGTCTGGAVLISGLLFAAANE
jgi:hypothetical protein